jgi:hypothetical protein
MELSARGITSATVPTFVWRNRKLLRCSNKTVDLRIWTWCLPNTKQESWSLDCGRVFLVLRRVIYIVTTVLYKIHRVPPQDMTDTLQDIISSKASRLAPRQMQSLTRCAPETVYPVSRVRKVRLTTHLNLSAEVRISGTIPPLPICLHGKVLQQQGDYISFSSTLQGRQTDTIMPSTLFYTES